MKYSIIISTFVMISALPVAWGQDQTPMTGMNHDMMPAATMPSMQTGAAAMATVRDPHAYADGYDFGPIPRPRFADEHRFASLLVDRLEWVHTPDATATAYDLQAWYGRDFNRALLKAEGDVDNGTLQEARTEILWGHAVSSFWDMQIGLRYDSGEAPDRSWLALGVQGLAPYWFEVTATAYLGNESRSALRLDAEYELLLSQRLILQPRFEADFYGKDDTKRSLGSGLSALTFGLRLRYELRRELAPYVGVEWAGMYGGTADYARAAGDDSKETRWVAGLRFWF